jgi:hypothetical protein
MFPGDMIEWEYTLDHRLVHKGEQLWSTTMCQWCPIDEKSLLIHVDTDTYTWLNSRGLFRARIDDTLDQPPRGGRHLAVTPRQCNMLHTKVY